MDEVHFFFLHYKTLVEWNPQGSHRVEGDVLEKLTELEILGIYGWLLDLLRLNPRCTIFAQWITIMPTHNEFDNTPLIIGGFSL